MSWISFAWSTSDQLTDDGHDSPPSPELLPLTQTPSTDPSPNPSSPHHPDSSISDNVTVADKQVEKPLNLTNTALHDFPRSSIPAPLASFKFIPLLETPTDTETPTGDEPSPISRSSISAPKATIDTSPDFIVSSDVRPFQGMTSPIDTSMGIPQHTDSFQTSPTTPTPLSGLRIDVAAANDPAMDREIEMADASFTAPNLAIDPSADLFDDEGLNALEKIYLYARSNQSFHRVFIARSLVDMLPDVSPCEAVEYVIPLMNGLAMDEDELVKDALLENLVTNIWWFLTHCILVDYEVPEDIEPCDPPLLNVQAFTPLLGTLLLNPSFSVGTPARNCVVQLLSRLREAETRGGYTGTLGPQERILYQKELICKVVIDMAHLDSNSPGETFGNDASDSTAESTGGRSDSGLENILQSPPPSAADDEQLLSTLTSSVTALATTQFLAQDETEVLYSPAYIPNIQRPPSPIPPTYSVVPIPEMEPDFAHITSQVSSVSADEGISIPSTQMGDTNLLETENRSDFSLLASGEDYIQEQDMRDISPPQIISPQPEMTYELDASKLRDTTEVSQVQADDSYSDFSEEQAAIGRLASMSLIAAVTASGSLDKETQEVFVKEVERASSDTVHWVRREATFALGALAKVVPTEVLYVSLLPLFDIFCGDPVSIVRVSVLFALPSLLSRLSPVERRIRAENIIRKASHDDAPEVRTGILEVLGEVIYTFKGDPGGPPDDIVRLFIGEEGRDWCSPESSPYELYSPRNPWSGHSVFPQLAISINDIQARQLRQTSSSPIPTNPPPDSDQARPLICAFNLPAVALTLGASRWAELRGLYTYLARSGASKVSQTLAASIGEVARIIGPEQSRRDLLYRWWDFVRGKDPAVRMKALEALDMFLQVLDLPDRLRIGTSLEEIWDNHLRGWREREILAKRLDQLAPLFPHNGEVLRTLLKKALRDRTAAVRKAAVESYPQIYKCLSPHTASLEMITEEVSSLSQDQSYKCRLTYIECINSLFIADVQNECLLDLNFWRSAQTLASDHVVDVRIGLARLVSLACDLISQRVHPLPDSAMEVVEKLTGDEANVVRSFVMHLKPRASRGNIDENSAFSVSSPPEDITTNYMFSTTFSRPPERRESRTLDRGINALSLSDAMTQTPG